ncbi:Mannose-6-phosphate isomerase [Paramyrothecium foliicola]|nr:Mannose-6-phosphate isomerase [Paramyrothecium foliicola]
MSCNSYPWGKQGSQSLAARLCAKTPGWTDEATKSDFSIDESKPYAEMWMGTYPVLPSYIASSGEDLQDVLDRYPNELLGAGVVKKFGDTKLPFLPKEFSKRKHEEDPGLFQDPNHKPEIALALSEFEAFCGFKPLHMIVPLLQLDPLKKFLVSGNAGNLKFTDEDLRAVVQKIFESPDNDLKQAYKGLIALPASTFTAANAHIPKLALRLAEQYDEADPGILTALLTMNYLILQPGESIYIPADGVHAYLSGDIIECMARSDNVLNTGFCPKAERNSAAEFCSVLKLAPRTVEQCMLKAKGYGRSEKGKTRMFAPPLSEFRVTETRLGPGEEELLGKNGPSIVLATKGSAIANVADETFELGEGHVYFVAQGHRIELKAKDDGLLLHTAYKLGVVCVLELPAALAELYVLLWRGLGQDLYSGVLGSDDNIKRRVRGNYTGEGTGVEDEEVVRAVHLGVGVGDRDTALAAVLVQGSVL